MSPSKTLATAARVLHQLSHDHRTVALILLVPTFLMVILRFVFNDATAGFENVAPVIMGIFPFTVMFLVTSITMLRERTNGTLERLMTMPIGRIDLLLGYALAFGTLAVCQSALVSAVTVTWLDSSMAGHILPVIVVALLAGLLGMALGLFVSAFAATEFQAVQFLPALIFPQLLLCGLFVARDSMHEVLQWFANLMPLTYVVDALQKVSSGSNLSEIGTNIAVIIGFALAALLLAAATLRRSR